MFDTFTISSGSPVDLLAHPTIMAELDRAVPEVGVRLIVQNVSGSARVNYAERAARPALTSRGHLLLVGAALDVRIRVDDRGAWIWSDEAGAVVAVSRASV